MKIYVGGPTGKRRDMIVNQYPQVGACLNRDNFSKTTAHSMPWFFDNGAFGDFRNKKTFNYEKFLKRLWAIEAAIRFSKLPCPDFVVIPDKVCNENSLRYSIAWLDHLNNVLPYFKYYIAIQDGMNIYEIEKLIKLRAFDGLFLGGSKPYKYKHGHEWVNLAHKYGLPIHCGGVGSRKTILWAKMTGFDSCDSALCMIHTSHLNDVLNIQQELLWSA